MSIEALKQELEKIRDILRRAIPCAYHDKECDISINPDNFCNCWVIDAYDILYPNEPVKESQDSICECKHAFNDHTVKFDKDFACSKGNCTCYAFKKCQTV